MQLLSGKLMSERMLERLRVSVAAEKFTPKLAVILVGENPASHLYVSLKEKAAQGAGILFERHMLPESVSQESVMAVVEKLNADRSVHGILVQVPLPGHLDTEAIIAAVDPAKDVDGFHPENTRLFLEGQERFFPVFPRAICELIQATSIPLEGKRAIVIANSTLFGKIMVKALERLSITGKYLLRESLMEHTEMLRRADILIAATGVQGIVNAALVKDGAVVIDGGIAKVGGKVLGDVDVNGLENRSGFLSPVPGGVGPVTIACLLENVVEACRRSEKK